MNKAYFSIVPAFLALLSVPAVAGTSCENLSSLSLPMVKVNTAQSIPAGDYTAPGSPGQTFKNLPAFCRVAATLTPSIDSDIKSEVWMPASGWNGKFEVVGNGGWAGTISYPEMAKGLANGYAIASTDTGHATEGGGFVEGHMEKLIDFMYRAEHETTVQGKSIIAAFYGNKPKHSYWSGCSTGGRQGLVEAVRYPDDFDGIVAGDPVNPRVIHDAWDITVTAAIQSKKESLIPAAKFAMIHKAVIDACDALDGVKDGLVENPKQCHFDMAQLTCKGADSDSCLTPAQVASVQLILSPAKSKGEDFFPGLALTSELGWKGKAGEGSVPPGAENYKYAVFKNNNWDWKTFNPDTDVPPGREMDKLESAPVPDLSAFTKRGGKLIMYHGWSDPLVSPYNTIAYYTAMQKQTKNAAASTRLFMVPGMGHCRGGEGATDTFDPVAAMDAWVVEHKVPQKIAAANVVKGATTRTRPLCAYPTMAHYTGKGSTDDAANFVCKAP